MVSAAIKTTIRGTALVVLLLPGVGDDSVGDDSVGDDSISRRALSWVESEAIQEYAPEMFACTSQRISSSCCSTTVASLSVV